MRERAQSPDSNHRSAYGRDTRAAPSRRFWVWRRRRARGAAEHAHNRRFPFLGSFEFRFDPERWQASRTNSKFLVRRRALSQWGASVFMRQSRRKSHSLVSAVLR
jgi:hypothetical protein